MTTRTTNDNPWTVHSTFRDDIGLQVKPRGLEWHVAGDSVMYYAYLPSSNNTTSTTKADWNLNDESTRQWLVQAHNKWCFARDWNFRHMDDIDQVQWKDDHHVEIVWKDSNTSHAPEQRFTLAETAGLLRMDASAKDSNEPPALVWINGYFFGLLQPDTVESLVEQVQQVPSKKLVYRKNPQSNIIRVERRFRGGIYGHDVYEHILDNLYALEDPQIIDDTTIIGTATLPDWIMGGELTSRLWVKQLEDGNILFLRPLYNDDTDTSDRKYMMKKGEDDAKIAVVEKELERIRYLATLQHPFEADNKTDATDSTTSDGSSVQEEEEKKEQPSPRALQHKRNRRKFFGL